METVIPRGEADRVMVVLGEHAGRVSARPPAMTTAGRGVSPLPGPPQISVLCPLPPPKVGRILEREPARSRALVQLERDEAGRVVPLDYDAVCHYLGGYEDD